MRCKKSPGEINPGASQVKLFRKILLSEEVLDLVHPGFGSWIVMAAVKIVDAFKFAQQLPLALGQIYRRLDDHMTMQVAMR